MHRRRPEAEVIPGITSAIAVPARAAIPVTLRKVSPPPPPRFSPSFLVTPACRRPKCRRLRRPCSAQGTVVLLMGVRTLPDTVAFCSRGIEADAAGNH